MSEKNGSKSFLIYFNLGAMVAYMSDEQAGKLFKGMISYAESRKEPDFKGDSMAQMVFENFRTTEDDNLYAWVAKREQRARAGMIGQYKRKYPEKSDEEIEAMVDAEMQKRKNSTKHDEELFKGADEAEDELPFY